MSSSGRSSSARAEAEAPSWRGFYRRTRPRRVDERIAAAVAVSALLQLGLLVVGITDRSPEPTRPARAPGRDWLFLSVTTRDVREPVEGESQRSTDTAAMLAGATPPVHYAERPKGSPVLLVRPSTAEWARFVRQFAGGSFDVGLTGSLPSLTVPSLPPLDVPEATRVPPQLDPPVRQARCICCGVGVPVERRSWKPPKADPEELKWRWRWADLRACPGTTTSSALERAAAGVRSCYRRRRPGEVGYLGALSVTWMLDRHGEVEDLRLQGDFSDTALLACFERALARVAIPRNSLSSCIGGGSVLMGVPDVFELAVLRPEPLRL